jgi:hypothetical protein
LLTISSTGRRLFSFLFVHSWEAAESLLNCFEQY